MQYKQVPSYAKHANLLPCATVPVIVFHQLSVFNQQAPYLVHVTSPNYLSLASVENAEVVENATQGNFTFRVTNVRLTLLPRAANAAQINYTVYTVGQVICATCSAQSSNAISLHLQMPYAGSSRLLALQPE